MVWFDPNYQSVHGLFDSLAPAVLLQTGADSVALHLMPNGVITDVYATSSLDEYKKRLLGHDVFASPLEQDGAVRAVTEGKVAMVGPITAADGTFSAVVRDPVYVMNVTANTTFGISQPVNPYCGAPCDFQAANRTKFWGFAAVEVSLAFLNRWDSPLRTLVSRGYDFELLAPNYTSGGRDRIGSSRPKGLPDDAVEIDMPLFKAEWVLRVYPVGGWTPSWFGGMLAGVILLAVALSILLLTVLVSRRQHQLLLKAVLPKDMIRELKNDADAPATPAGGMKVMNADTPADMLLNMMGELLEGYMPDMRDVVFIRTALMRNMDVYQPLNLRKHLRGSSLDADVVKALMRQLGNGGDLDGASTIDGNWGDELDKERLTGGREAPAPQQEACDTLSGTLTLLFNVQTIPTLNILADAADVAVHSYWNLREENSGYPGPPQPASGPPVSLGEAPERPSFNKFRGKKSPLILSGSGRQGAPGQQQQQQQQQALTVPTTIIEESERLLAQVDDWQFDTWALQEATQWHALSTLGFYLITRLGLAQRFKLKPVTLARQVEAGYLDNPYHNATHAADVLQTLHVIVHAAQLHVHYLDQLGLLAAYYAAIVHDYGHPGLTSDFLIATSDPLAIRYNDRSPLENHHCAASFALLRRPELDVFAPLSSSERASLRKQIVHDYGHPGLTSDFLIATSDPLAIRYNDRSPLENHHCAASFALLRRPELDVFAPLSSSERASLRKQVIELVLATDMKQHFSIISHFNTVHRLTSYSQQQAAAALAPSNSLARVVSLRPTSGSSGDKKAITRPSPPPQQLQPCHVAPRPVDETERLLSLQMAIKCADIGHLGEALEVHKRWLLMLEEEFFRQGDRERELSLPISPLFDRAKQGVSKSQVGFYEFVALPLVHALGSAFPGSQPLVRCFVSNYNHWRVVDGQPPVELPKSKSGRGAEGPVLTRVSSGKSGDAPGQARPSSGKPRPAAPLLPMQEEEEERPSVGMTLSED
ncbi:hypothetical protein GPECTOR_11g138 [Gonium pectorale]|uniref:Phosphodiesterase n=1 Tax=Gonium pectorale TaxID=33097 RepID=A0A150GPD5_GONPE|nr:hypothetical protein GPECTOR_11g138 [Gonium pectorale]|eukprot:KXZ51687.1 hypothetical protein GPECTOR_11g138 [Gonium pectorale]